MTLHLSADDDLSERGKQLLEQDFLATDRRDGGKTSRADFALGWMACVARAGIWSWFTDDAKGRIQNQP